MSALLDFQCQILPVITGLLLLAAFSWPSGDLYKQSGVFMAPWVASSELCVLVKWIKNCDVCLPSFQSVSSHQWLITRPILPLHLISPNMHIFVHPQPPPMARLAWYSLAIAEWTYHMKTNHVTIWAICSSANHTFLITIPNVPVYTYVLEFSICIETLVGYMSLQY